MAGKARLEKMRLHLAAGETAQALEAAQQAISVLGEDPAYLLVLAKAQSAAREYTQAITTYGKLTRLAPQSRLPYMGQVEVYAAEQNWKAAREAAVRAVGAAPDDIATRLVLIDTGMRAGMHDQAIKDALAVQTRWPDVAAGYAAESHVHLAQKRSVEAEGALRRGLARTRDPALVTRLAALYASQGRRAEAEAFLERWFAEHPDDIATLDALGRAALSQKDFASAERWYRKAVQAKPGNAALLNNLAWALGKLRNPEAITMAKRAVEADPMAIQFQATLGAVHLALGDATTAEAVLRKAIEKQPALSWAHVHLGQALLAQGKRDEARKELEAAKKLAGLQAVKEELEELEKGLAN
jgi:tetratricopeptide (TPR) repeat protein